MKQTISFLSLTALLAGSVACSSTENNNNNAAVDAGDDSSTTTDSATTDSGSKDSGTDTAVATGCATDLPSSYACPAFPVPAGSTACTEAMLQEYAVKCVTADLTAGAECAAWKTANAACKTCVEAWSWDDDKVYPDDYKCYEKLVPGCGKSINCTIDCADTVCADCEDQSTYNECASDANKMGGRCYDLATKNADSCVKDTKGAPCEVSQYYTGSPNLETLKGEVIRVLRGACRDNADWAQSGSAGDAGTDASTSETGDTGADDAATDSASDAATDSATDAATDATGD